MVQLGWQQELDSISRPFSAALPTTPMASPESLHRYETTQIMKIAHTADNKGHVVTMIIAMLTAGHKYVFNCCALHKAVILWNKAAMQVVTWFDRNIFLVYVE